MKMTAFDIYHPAVAAVYFAVVLAFSMLAFQPVFVCVSLAGALLCALWLRGWREVLAGFAWQVPLLIIVAIANPIFAQQGSTELFRIAGHAFFAESFAYGLCMGAMLVAVILWFGNAARIVTPDKTMMLTGGMLPTVGLMMSMVTRLVPQLVERGRVIAGTARMNTAGGAVGAGAGAGIGMGMDAGAGAGAADAAVANGADASGSASIERASKRARAHRDARTALGHLNVLMGWSMEDSLETADAMRARGWGATSRRTTYQRSAFRLRDAFMLVAVGALSLLCAVCAVAAVTQFSFYPRMSTLILWWGYIPFALLMLWPFVLEAGEAIAWKLR